MKCSSGKEHGFATAGEAWKLANALARRDEKRFGLGAGSATRAYPCERCHRWHVTSKPRTRKRGR